MISLVIWFIISLLVLWLTTMVILWRKQSKSDVLKAINPLVEKGVRSSRRLWFLILRGISRFRSYLTKLITKLFFMIFPNARAAFEKKDELTGLEQGPSSYFLMSISEGLQETQDSKPVETPKKHGRKSKNV